MFLSKIPFDYEDWDEETEILNKYIKRKGFSEKDCVCGGHNAHNVKKNKNHSSTKKKLDIRKKRKERMKQKMNIGEDI